MALLEKLDGKKYRFGGDEILVLGRNPNDFQKWDVQNLRTGHIWSVPDRQLRRNFVAAESGRG